ncbi:MAG: carboxypeptidase M32 [Synergistaceae bacterium]|jgi:carboxypeptidase Taq|nr:carboxypeptidase M32 [Synergistaceae bacterium]
MSKLASFKELMREIDITSNIMNTLSWDMRVNLPPKAAAYRAETMGFLSGKLYSMKTSPKLYELCGELSAVGNNDRITARMIKEALKEYKRLTEIPQKLYSDFTEHNLKAELVWQEARAKNDYAMLKDSLVKEFDYKRQFAACHGFAENPMDGLMDEYEEGMTTKKLDKIFDELKASVKELLGKIDASSKAYDKTFIFGKYPIDRQRAFCKRMVGIAGFDLLAGRLDESAHPYTTGNNKYDIRMTTRYFENNFTNAALSSMHEMGHSVYAQNHLDDLAYTTLDHSPSFGWDEGQSRFFENIIGRSEPFWAYFLPMAQTYFDGLYGMKLNDFYNSLNAVYRDPRRLDADELTYNLHIVIRYELEKTIFAGQVSFDDLPDAWNLKCKEYLGITPKNDAEGVLQDMHWASGYIGYFQNYVLGNCYDGHLLNKMKQDIPDMYDQVANGKFDEILGWQIRNVHTHGCFYNPEELLERVTGEKLSAAHYIHYLNDKYSRIYKL